MRIKHFIYLIIFVFASTTIASSCMTQSHSQKAQKNAAKKYGSPRDCGCK